MITTELLFLLLTTAGLLLTITLQLRDLIKIKKHNLVLFRIRSTHDEILLYLVDNIDNESLSIKDKIEIRNTLERLDKVTTFFDKAKKRFKFRILTSVLFTQKHSPFIESNDREISPILTKVRVKVTGALLFAFSEYIPLFKVRLSMQLISALSKFIILTGMTEILKHFSAFNDLKKAVETYNKVDNTYHQLQTCEA